VGDGLFGAGYAGALRNDKASRTLNAENCNGGLMSALTNEQHDIYDRLTSGTGKPRIWGIVRQDGAPLNLSDPFPIGEGHEEEFSFSVDISGITVAGKMLATGSGFALLKGSWSGMFDGRNIEMPIAGAGPIEEAEWVPVSSAHFYGRPEAALELREHLVFEAVDYLASTFYHDWE